MTVPSLTVVRVASSYETAGLAAYLERLLALDDRAAVRLQARGTALGVWSGPPFEVLALRPVALGSDLEVDATVSAQRLLEQVHGAEMARGFALPPSMPGPAWAGLLPPRTGWEQLATVDTSVVAAAVADGVAEFRLLSEYAEEGSRDRSTLQGYADQVWARELLAGVPLRAAHAAEALGLLGYEGSTAAFSAGSWLRLACPGGSVALRRPGADGLGLLSIL